jgi:hypothetical protein
MVIGPVQRMTLNVRSNALLTMLNAAKAGLAKPKK